MVLTEFVPGKADLRELRRPWKLVTFAAGMAFLFYGATLGMSDWDVGISLFMGCLAYLSAPWALRTTLDALRTRPPHWILRIAVAVAAAWFTVDGIYVLYHTPMGNTMFRIENFWMASLLYMLTGLVWFYYGTLRDLISDAKAVVRSNWNSPH